jgi:hypothetical protein
MPIGRNSRWQMSITQQNMPQGIELFAQRERI